MACQSLDEIRPSVWCQSPTLCQFKSAAHAGEKDPRSPSPPKRAATPGLAIRCSKEVISAWPSTSSSTLSVEQQTLQATGYASPGLSVCFMEDLSWIRSCSMCTGTAICRAAMTWKRTNHLILQTSHSLYIRLTQTADYKCVKVLGCGQS